MVKNNDFTYVLYLDSNIDKKNILYLGSCKDPIKLYYEGLNIDNITTSYKNYVIEWLNLVDVNLDPQEKYDLEYAFMYNPQNGFSYSIKNMTLYIKKIKSF
jgi:hypothetical protein